MNSFIAIDQRSGVPFYRQIIDQILIAVATGALRPGTQLPTVRQLAIDAKVNPNTVTRAYRELEIRGVVNAQRGMGTFVADKPEAARDEAAHRAGLEQYCDGIVADAGKWGFTLVELINALQDRLNDRR